METWMKIAYAIALGALVIFLFPRAKEMLKNSPRAQKGDWQGVIIPLIVVVLLIMFLIQSVR